MRKKTYTQIEEFIKSRTRDGTVKCLSCLSRSNLIDLKDTITCTKCGCRHYESGWASRYPTKVEVKPPVNWKSYNDNQKELAASGDVAAGT